MRGWGGFSLEKLTLLAVGIGEYWWGGANVTSAGTVALYKSEWLPSAITQAFLLALFVHFLWQRRGNGRWRATAIVFLGTFVAGEVMNVGGLSRRIVDFALALVGHLRGGDKPWPACAGGIEIKLPACLPFDFSNVHQRECGLCDVYVIKSSMD